MSYRTSAFFEKNNVYASILYMLVETFSLEKQENMSENIRKCGKSTKKDILETKK